MRTRCRSDCRAPVRSQCHCSVCHATVRSVTDFERHRFDGRCLDLTSIGLVEVDGMWATPEGQILRERLSVEATERNTRSDDL